MLDKLIILKETGEEINVELVSVFLIPDIKKQFAITTTNEIDPNGLVKLHVSEIKNNKLYKVENDDDWAVIKTVMRSIISSSAGNYQYLSALSKVESVTDYTRGIAVQIVAKEQLANDYKKNKPTDMAIKPTADNKPEVEKAGPPAHVMTETTIEAPQGNVVAPGIVETPPVNNTFEEVKVPEAPTDLIIEPSSPAVEALTNSEEIKPAEVIPETPVEVPTNDTPVINIETPSAALAVEKPSEPITNEVVTPSVNQEVVTPNTTSAPAPAMDLKLFQEMYNQMMAQQQMNNPTSAANNNQNAQLSEEELNNIINEARATFEASVKSLVETIINNVNTKLKEKVATEKPKS